MYRITTPRRLYLVGSIREVCKFLSILGKTGLTLKQYLKEQSTL